MLSAKQAREKSEQMFVANFMKDVEKVINKNIEKGRNEARISGKIPPEVVLELMNKGYHIEELEGLTKISW